MLFMLIEHFRNGDPGPVYARLRTAGRQVQDGVRYAGSWVTADLARCYQVMDCDSRDALDAWLRRWSDLVDFEVVPVITSAEAAARVAGR
jgi:hypothetical protein